MACSSEMEVLNAVDLIMQLCSTAIAVLLFGFRQ